MITAEESADMMCLRVSVFHSLVVDAKAFEQFLVFTSEGLLLHPPVMPCDDDPAGGLQDAGKLTSRSIWFEPMEGLAGGDKVDAGIAERSGFGGALDAGEAVVGGETLFASAAHLGIRFHAVNAIAFFQEQFAEEPGAGTDIGDDVAGAQAAFRTQDIEHGWGIDGAVADIVRHTIGEALFGVGKGHSAYSQ